MLLCYVPDGAGSNDMRICLSPVLGINQLFTGDRSDLQAY